MKLTPLTQSVCLFEAQEDAPIFSSLQSGLDIIAATWSGETEYKKIVFLQEEIAPEFFDLKTKIAGEILQKFVNYGFQISIVGDFGGYTSQSLWAFIKESNKGKVVYFTDSVNAAIQYLQR